MSLIQDAIDKRHAKMETEEGSNVSETIDSSETGVVDTSNNEDETGNEPVIENTPNESESTQEVVNNQEERQVEESVGGDIDATPKSPEETFYNETSRKIDEYLRAGGELNDEFFKYQSIDFDNVDTSDVNHVLDLLEKELVDVSGFTKEEAAFTIEKRYPNLYRDIDEEDDYDIKSYKDDMTQAGIDLKMAIPKLKDFQSKVLLPKREDVNQPTQEELDRRKEAMDNYFKDANEAIKGFDKLTVKLNNDVYIDIETNQESLKGVSDLLLNPESQGSYLVNNYVDKEGKIDFDKLKTDEFWRLNRDKILKEHYIQAYNIGKEEALKEQGLSPTISNRGNAGGSDHVSTVRDQVLKNMRR